MEIQIISTETIKPSSPTPHHLKTHKLSLMDQAYLDVYYPLLIFYSREDKITVNISDHLKTSLSETLTHYYPFSGRVKDDYSIVCDDSGATFVEARVSNYKMSEVLKTPEIDILEQLLPYNPNGKVTTQVNLVVQLNYFDCGGVAICICFRHAIADATAAAYFVKNWAAVACGSSDIGDVVLDCTSIFPPHDSMRSIMRSLFEKELSMELITKRFMFDGDKLAALREKINMNRYSLVRPTRFEAVSALIWGALITMARERDESTPLANIVVGVRKRMDPPLPQQCIGNFMHTVRTSWSMDKAVDYNSLARNIHESIKIVNDDYVRRVYEDDSFVNRYRKEIEGFLKSNYKARMFCFDGWGGLPYYETDFGWGKPTWVSTAMRFHDVAILLDTFDGKGVEAWVGLPKNDMLKLEQDFGILTYASFNPCI